MGFWSGVKTKLLSPISIGGRGGRGGWWPWSVIREPNTGSWQKNEEWRLDDVSAFYAVYSCITLISSDIGKMPMSVRKENADGIWNTAKYKSYAKLLKKPNPYQNHIQFKQWWITSKLFRGNVYGLKYRGQNNEVERIYVLNPDLVNVLVSDSGAVFYQLSADNLSGLTETTITVPAEEIIHDRMNCLFHPLVGISPLYASGLAAHQGLKIQNDSVTFFSNGARPGGILTAPGAISDETAARIKGHWDLNYGGANSGKVAVLGDNLKFEAMRMNSSDAQLMEQLNWTAEVVCSTFHVPAYKVGVGSIPPNNNIDALTTEYYTQCLQILIEEMELCLSEGLALPDEFEVHLDLDVLFRMDGSTLMKVMTDGVKGMVVAPNEARKKFNLPPIAGGDTVYAQQQEFSLDALSRRDARDDPFAKSGTAPATTAVAPVEETDEKQLEAQASILQALVMKEVNLALSA